MLNRTAVVRSAIAVLGLVLAVSLSACVSPGGDPVPTNDPTDSPSIPSPSLPPATSPSPSPSETAAPEKPTPVSVPCNSIVDAQTMYDFNPNYGLLASFSPDAGSLIASAANNDGTVCRWINQTSGITIDIGISKPGPTALAAAHAAAETGTAINGLGDRGFFSTVGGSGVVQVFEGDSWIVVASPAFSTALDALDIVNSAQRAAL